MPANPIELQEKKTEWHCMVCLGSVWRKLTEHGPKECPFCGSVEITEGVNVYQRGKNGRQGAY